MYVYRCIHIYIYTQKYTSATSAVRFSVTLPLSHPARRPPPPPAAAAAPAGASTRRLGGLSTGVTAMGKVAEALGPSSPPGRIYVCVCVYLYIQIYIYIHIHI